MTEILIEFKMGWQRLLKVRGLMFGLVTLQALGMTRGEGLVSDKDLESRAEVLVEEKKRMVVVEKMGVRVLVRDDTPTTHCREMLANLEVRNFENGERKIVSNNT